MPTSCWKTVSPIPARTIGSRAKRPSSRSCSRARAALQAGELYGFWGGMTEQEREELLLGRRGERPRVA
ncbi:WhiB family transcriptional regulator [Streptomyces sp. NBC_01136]|nr:WhiB family transcriptional regulator [Streptomyces sp. NBC_01136]